MKLKVIWKRPKPKLPSASLSPQTSLASKSPIAKKPQRDHSRQDHTNAANGTSARQTFSPPRAYKTNACALSLFSLLFFFSFPSSSVEVLQIYVNTFTEAPLRWLAEGYSTCYNDMDFLPFPASQSRHPGTVLFPKFISWLRCPSPFGVEDQSYLWRRCYNTPYKISKFQIPCSNCFSRDCAA